MQITFKCQECGTQMEAASDLFGTQSSCPNCEAVLRVPEARVEPGTRIAGFEVLRRVGFGAMGEVFMAQQLAMDRTVALKILPAQFSEDESRIERFLHEARMAAKLEHPNIVTVLDAGEDTGFYFLAMSYVEGETLERRVKRLGKMEEKEALHILMKIAGGLAMAWERHQMLHRDIKPANIMVDQYGEPKLLDMGLAKTLLEDKKMTMTGMIVGTPLYMSPEQARSQYQLDHRADIYSLGTTLYHMLTGRPPYLADSVVGIIAKHALDPLPDAKELNPDLSPECLRLLEIMLAKKPEDRQPTWRDVVADMQAVMRGSMPGDWDNQGIAGGSTIDRIAPISPSPAGGPRVRIQQAKEGKNNKTLVIALAGGLIVGLIVAVVAIRSMRKTDDPRTTGGVKASGGTTAAIPASTTTTTPLSGNTEHGGTGAPPAKPIDYGPLAARIDGVIRTGQDYLESHPTSHDSVIALLEDLREGAAATPLEDRVEQAILNVQRARDTAINSTMRKLRAEADSLADKDRHDEAVNMLLTYKGPWAAETVLRRERTARELAAAKVAEKEATPEPVPVAPVPAVDHWKVVSEKTADALLASDFKTALAALDGGLKNGKLADRQSDLEALRSVVVEVDAVPQTILKSLAKDIGKEVKLYLNQSKDAIPIEVEKIDGIHVTAKRIIREDGKTFTGRMPNNFTYADIAIKERVNRLGKGSEPYKLMTRALWAIELGQPDAAERLFKAMPAPFADIMMAAMARQQAAAAAVAAENQLKAVLKVAKLEYAGTPFAQLIAWQKNPHVDSERNAVRDAAATYLRDYPKGELTQTWGGLLQTLAEQVKPPRGLLPIYGASAPNIASFSGDLGQNAVERVAYVQSQTRLPLEVVDGVGIHFRLIPNCYEYLPGAENVSRPFYLSKYEVTESQWQAVVGSKRGGGRANYPVEDLRWDDAYEFIERLTELEAVPAYTYRVPTTYELMYANAGTMDPKFGIPLRAGSAALYTYGNYLDKSAPESIGAWKVALMRDTRDDGHSTLAPVGSYIPNPFGVYDLVGNVSEYAVSMTNFDIASRPVISRRLIEQRMATGDLTYVMGGNWFTKVEDLQATLILSYSKVVAEIDEDTRPKGLGLRLVRETDDPARISAPSTPNAPNGSRRPGGFGPPGF